MYRPEIEDKWMNRPEIDDEWINRPEIDDEWINRPEIEDEWINGLHLESYASDVDLNESLIINEYSNMMLRIILLYRVHINSLSLPRNKSSLKILYFLSKN